MEKEIQIKNETIEKWGLPLQTSTVYPNLTYKAYETILIPRIGFSLTNTTLTPKQIKKLQIKADQYYIPKLNISSKFPRTILRASYNYGGFQQTTIQMTQIIKQIQMTLGCTRDNNDTSKILQCSIEITQLETGLTTPILSHSTSTDFLHYTTRTWTHSIKDSLTLINGSIQFTTHWHPKLQRLGDCSLMQQFLNHYPITYINKNGKTKKSKSNIKLIQILNRCRIFLQVITLSDITDLSGKK